LVRYPPKVVRLDVDHQRNPFGLALDCYDGAPQRIEAPLPVVPRPARPAAAPAFAGRQPVKHHILAIVAGLVLGFGLVPEGHTIEVLRWQRLRLTVRLVVASSALSSSTATCASACPRAWASGCACRARAVPDGQAPACEFDLILLEQLQGIAPVLIMTRRAQRIGHCCRSS
jgi:hypothetical protein